MRQLPVTVVIALHDLNQAMACDRIGVMDHGHLVADGPPAEVLTTERLQTTFGVQADLIEDPLDGSHIMRFRNAI